MRTVPLAYGETCRPYRWRQFVVIHPERPFALLDLHARLKIRVKAWAHPSHRLIEEARFARFVQKDDPDASFVADVVGTVG